METKLRPGVAGAGIQKRRPVGRPRKTLDIRCILDLRDAGKSWFDIARANRAGITTVRRAYLAVRPPNKPDAASLMR